MNYISKQVVIEGIDAQTILLEFNATKKLINDLLLKLKKESYDESLMTREETARLLKVSLPTLNEWTKKGILRSYRLGNVIRYKKEEVIISLIPTRK
jgi:excisionase family DNA binding protein